MEAHSSASEPIFTFTDDARIGVTTSDPFADSPTFDLIPFLLDPGQSAHIGSYVVVRRDSGDGFHFGRVIDGKETNAEAAPGRLQQTAAYGFGGGRPIRPGERSPHLTREMAVEVLGEIVGQTNAGTLELSDPARLPQTGMSVYLIPATAIPQLLGIPTNPDEGLHLGEVRSGNDEAPFLFPVSALARHIAVTGKSGSGKSYFAGVLVEELVEKEIPVVSFDVLGDFVAATRHHQGHNLRAGTDVRVPYSLIGWSEFQKFVPTLTTPQKDIVSLAYSRIHGRAMDTLNRTGDFEIPLSDFLAEISEVAVSFNQEKVGNNAIPKIRSAVGNSPLLTDEMGHWLSEIGSRPIVNVFVGHLGQEARNLLVGAASRLLQIMRTRGQIPPFVYILDEAHFFLPSGGTDSASTAVVRELIRTARHHAIGVAVVTQSPSSLDRQVLLLCNTKVTFALERDDLRVVSGTLSDLPTAVIDRIPKMPRGRAIISSGADIVRHAVPVEIRERRSPEGAPTPNLAEQAQQWRDRRSGLAANSGA